MSAPRFDLDAIFEALKSARESKWRAQKLSAPGWNGLVFRDQRLDASSAAVHLFTLERAYLLVRHKVSDFSTWKAAYGAHLPARQKAGLKQEHLLRSIDDPNEVILLFEAEDVQKAQEFGNSSDLREAMQKAGVVDKPDIYFLS